MNHAPPEHPRGTHAGRSIHLILTGTMMTIPARRGVFAAAMLALLGSGALIACTDVLGSQPEPEVEEADETAPPLTPPGIHPELVVVSQHDGTAVLELRMKRVDLSARIASVQGELTYDPEPLTLGGAAFPQGITGAWNEVRPGTVRFAGIAVEGIEGETVLTLTFTSRTEALAEHFTLRIEELVASEGFRNLAPVLRLEEGRPEFSVAQVE